MTRIRKETVIDHFNNVAEEALSLTIYCRDEQLQKEMVDKLEADAKKYISYKNQARDNRDGVFADIMFGFHNLLNSIKFCLKSILALKEGDPLNGWCRLIDAEEHLEFASLAKEHLFGLDEYHEQLKMLERSLFPHFTVFNSPGLIEERGKCNICFEDIHVCDHIQGKLYDGIVCFEVGKKLVSLDHSSIVVHPRDRRCIITKISTDDGYMMDYLTLKKLEKIPEEKMTGGMLTECILIQSKDLEIN